MSRRQGASNNNAVNTFPAANNPYLLSEMSISEMRALHSKAIRDAEAKQTELRLVLSSRYRDLVGSSDEVLAMRDMAQKLYETLGDLPHTMQHLQAISSESAATMLEKSKGLSSKKKKEQVSVATVSSMRYQLSSLPRILHRALDKENPHTAALALVKLFTLIHIRCSNTTNKSGLDQFPLAKVLASKDIFKEYKQLFEQNTHHDEHELNLLDTQIQMVYLHVQTLPFRIVKLSKKVLLHKSLSAIPSKAALTALALLDVKKSSSEKKQQLTDSATRLLEIYYDSKAKLLRSLLDDLNQMSSNSSLPGTAGKQCEKIMTDIVTVIQFDIILHSYQIFTLPSTSNISNSETTLLPYFDPHLVKSKCSHFLATHIPLLRSKIRNVLVSSVAVDAGMLGGIRQSLYDASTKPKGISPEDWNKAVDAVVDGRLVTPASYGGSSSGGSSNSPSTSDVLASVEGEEDDVNNGNMKKKGKSHQKFSLWSSLFSTTFSSLVHDLLSSSFHSVHTSTMSSLLQSLSRAPRRPPPTYNTSTEFCPSFSSANLLLRAHEAHRNNLLIASRLDQSLSKLSDDAHKLLVHAEERVESEHRLRQSLYVQTCEIMGRLLSEIRRMVMKKKAYDIDQYSSNEDFVENYGQNDDDDEYVTRIKEDEDTTKLMVVGRLCHLLQYRRLNSLKISLDSKNAPASSSVINSNIGSNDMNGLGLENRTNATASAISANLLQRSSMSRGMITLEELKSAFEIADDDDDGVISFSEAVEAMGGAFSGTPFNGAEMVRSTLMMGSSSAAAAGAAQSQVDNTSGTVQNVTLFELALLSAKGLRHDAKGSASAMGLIHSCLQVIIHHCFENWARIALDPPYYSLEMKLNQQWRHSLDYSEKQWLQLHGPSQTTSSSVGGEERVSGQLMSYFLSVSCEMNSAVCPADSVPSAVTSAGVPSHVEIIRQSLLRETLLSLARVYSNICSRLENDEGNAPCDPCLIQLLVDIKFIQGCFFDGDTFMNNNEEENTKDELEKSANLVLSHLSTYKEASFDNNSQSIDTSRLFLSNLFGPQHQKLSSSDTKPSSSSISGSASSSQKLLLNPDESLCRFVLLPIQSDKEITDLELRRARIVKKEEVEEVEEKNPNNTSSGFGFFSSMMGRK